MSRKPLDPGGRDIPPNSRWRCRAVGAGSVTVVHLAGKGSGFEVIYRPDGYDRWLSQGRTSFLRSHTPETALV